MESKTDICPEHQDAVPDKPVVSGPPEEASTASPVSRWLQLGAVSMTTFLAFLPISSFAPALPTVSEDLKSTSNAMATFALSAFLLGLSVGPLLWAPLSELFGRQPVYFVGDLGFIGFTVACARACTMPSLCTYRFFEGIFAGVPVTLAAGTIADIFQVHERGKAIGLWVACSLLSPGIGPLYGAYVTARLSWRWTFLYFVAVASTIVCLATLAIHRETYTAAKRERPCQENTTEVCAERNTGRVFLSAIVRPTRLLFRSAPCAYAAIYQGICFAIINMLGATHPWVFRETHHFTTEQLGFVYLGTAIGAWMGSLVFALYSDKLGRKNGPPVPECRLHPALTSAGSLMPLGVLIYGWTIEARSHWSLPIAAMLLYGVGLNITFMAINAYLIDLFSVYAASALAAGTVLKNLFAGIGPTFTLQLYHRLGMGWGNTLLAAICLIVYLPMPFLYAFKLKNIA